MRRSARRWWLAGCLLLAVAMAVTGWLLDRLLPLPLARSRHTSVQILAADGGLLRAFTTGDGYWRLPLPPAAVDPLYLRMLLAYEDQRFYQHPGVDPLALLRAVGQFLWQGHIVSGGSTLTMQVARLLEPIPHTLPGKLVQILRALQLEWHLSKRRILALYFELAPYGGNLEGLRAASLAYFGKEPAHLTPAEAALLVVLPQAPEALRPDRHPAAARAARAKVLARMVRRGLLSRRQAVESQLQPLPRRRRPLPLLAPQLARRLRLAAPDRRVQLTTIDRHLQQLLAALGRAELAQLDPRANLALLVVRNRDRAVLGYLGSADFLASARGGQLDLVQAVRSPGSTLKPIVYGLAFDQLVIQPETLILDAPARFGDYQPSDFNQSYHGWVSAREALQRSLNVPAVAVLAQLGPLVVVTRLKQAGIDLQWPADQPPGLPLVLGGVGTRLSDLVMLYSAIATDGVVRPLRYRPARRTRVGIRLLSAAASWQLRAILAATPPPPALPAGGSRIAYKTGTSYGFRDAWALGFDRDYTVGVWVGRPDGTPSPGHYGLNTAAPLLFHVFDLLPASVAPPGPMPAGVWLASNAQLPPRLRRLTTVQPLVRPVGTPLALSFPVSGTTLELQPGQQALPLLASGGQRPLHWLVNGQPLVAAGLGSQAFWPVPAPGAVRVTVLDSAGHSASAEIWVERAR